MSNDEKYAEAFALEAAYKLSEIEAIEATYKALIATKRAEHAERYYDANEAYLLKSEADRLDRISRYYEDTAQSDYEAWAAYAEANIYS